MPSLPANEITTVVEAANEKVVITPAPLRRNCLNVVTSLRQVSHFWLHA